jgi:hypothetical protein
VKEVGRIEDSKEKTNFSLFKEVKLDQFFDWSRNSSIGRIDRVIEKVRDHENRDIPGYERKSSCLWYIKRWDFGF